MDRICNKCHQPKPAEEFKGRSLACLACKAEYLRAWRNNKGGNRPGRPATKGETARVTSGKRPQFKTRTDLEFYLRRELEQTAGQFNDIIAGCKKQMKMFSDQKMPNEFVKAMNGYRQVLKDKRDFLVQLTKHFELLATLDKPSEEDPRYTPVELILSFDPPAECIVSTTYSLDEDDSQPPLPDD